MITTGGFAATARIPRLHPAQRPIARWYRVLRRHSSGVAAGIVLALIVVVGAFPTLVTSRDPTSQPLEHSLAPPGRDFPLGADGLGRDVAARLAYGARYSLVVAAATTGLGLAAGGGGGIVAGFVRGRVEVLMLRLSDILLALPGVLVALLVLAVIGSGLWPLILAVTLHSVPIFLRVIYGATLQVSSQPFVEAAHAIGAGRARILWRHVVPMLVPELVALATTRMSQNLLLASALSFFGLGIQPPTPEWGVMVRDGRNYLAIAPYLFLLPGLAIVVTAVSFSLLSDSIHAALDPRLRSRGSMWG